MWEVFFGTSFRIKNSPIKTNRSQTICIATSDVSKKMYVDFVFGINEAFWSGQMCERVQDLYLMASEDGPLTNLPYLSPVFSASSLPSLFLSPVSLPILPSFSSYFSLLPGARRSVPDGNSLRLQEPPQRPHGGGTGGEQSGPVLSSYPSLSHVLVSPFAPLFSLSPRTLVFPLSISSVSSLPGYTGPQGDLLLAQVPQHRALSSFSSPTTSPQLLIFCSCPPSSPLLPYPAPSLGKKTVRPSSPELSISEGVYLQRDRPTHLERIFTSVHTLSPSLFAGPLYILMLPPDTFL